MSIQIQSFVFFDIETTGLPWQERNQTKFIEISLVSVQRRDIVNCCFGDVPTGLNKLTFLLNPQRTIDKTVSTMTGISRKSLQNAPIFSDKFDSIKYFLYHLQAPVCLIAHNGNSFDYKILLAECCDIQMSLPSNLMCIDSLVGFRSILKGTTISYQTLQSNVNNIKDWPEMEFSIEELEQIDSLCNLVPEDCILKTENNKKITKTLTKKKNDVINNIFKSKSDKNTRRVSYTLSALYERLLGKAPVGAHRAENDCLMLIQCFVAMKKDILPWADSNCVPLTNIKPLIRY